MLDAERYVRNYIQKCRALGYSDVKIQSTLMQNKMDASLVSRILQEKENSSVQSTPFQANNSSVMKGEALVASALTTPKPFYTQVWFVGLFAVLFLGGSLGGFFLFFGEQAPVSSSEDLDDSSPLKDFTAPESGTETKSSSKTSTSTISSDDEEVLILDSVCGDAVCEEGEDCVEDCGCSLDADCATGYSCVDTACILDEEENVAPSFVIQSETSVDEGDAIVIQVVASDDDGDSLGYTYSVSPSISLSGVTIADSDSADDLYTWQTSFGDAGDYVFTVTVDDGVESVSDSVTITVEEVCRAEDIPSCGNGVDDDGDGYVDYVSEIDSDCSSWEDEEDSGYVEESVCDSNGLVDGYGACDSDSDGNADIDCSNDISSIKICRAYCTNEGYSYVAVAGSCDGKKTESVREFAPIYVSIYTHIEEPGKTSSDYVEDEEEFWKMYNAVKEFAEMTEEEGVHYNLQSDWNFLEAIALYDAEGTAETNNKNLLRYLHEDLGIGIDPHAHESTHNYADVAYLIAQLGVEPSGVVGGFLASPLGNSKVDYLQEPIHGDVYDYTWEAKILWGGGTAGHKNEEDLWASGVWRPKSSAEFFTDDANTIPNIGKYDTSWEGLSLLLEKQKSGELDPNKIYTTTIPAKQTDVLIEGYSEEFREKIQSFDQETQEGRIIWIELSDIIDVWEQEYNSEANILKYEY